MRIDLEIFTDSICFEKTGKPLRIAGQELKVLRKIR
jgi:hypothetical protein